MDGYKIVYAQTLEALETTVNESIADGWLPYGSVVLDHEGRRFAQPMTKSETLKS